MLNINQEGNPNLTFHRPDAVLDKLYVITPVFNPQRYRTRWKLYKNFEAYVLNNNQAHLVTIECTYGNREKAIVEQQSDKHTVIHVKTKDEIWLKENMINRAIQSLPEDWKYVAWIDADITFARPDWVGECIQQLQYYDVIQMFSEAQDVSPKFEVIKSFKSFMSSYVKNGYKAKEFGSKYTGDGHYWHPGFAWAARKQAIDSLGGLIDWSILGGGDMYMAYGLIGGLENRTMPQSLGERGIESLKLWQERAEQYIKRNVGFMEGTIMHYWHGSKKNRAYKDRGQILLDAKFEPNLDLKRDWQGMYQLTDRSIELRDGARAYFRQRNEDGIDE